LHVSVGFYSARPEGVYAIGQVHGASGGLAPNGIALEVFIVLVTPPFVPSGLGGALGRTPLRPRTETRFS